jgi:hypothetical protein
MLPSFVTAFGVVKLISFASCANNSATLLHFNAAPGLQALEQFRRSISKQVETGADSQLIRPATSLRSEPLEAEGLVDGYVFINLFSNDDCSTFLSGSAFILNTCIHQVCLKSDYACVDVPGKTHFKMTATSATATVVYYSDFGCTVKESFSPDESIPIVTECSSRSKVYFSPTSYLLQYPVSHVAVRLENREHLPSISSKFSYRGFKCDVEIIVNLNKKAFI